MHNRRSFLTLAGGMALASAATPLLGRNAGGNDTGIGAAPDLVSLEAASGGRLGVALMPSGGETVLGHRQDERFPMCSTFKSVLAATVLARADRGQLSLDLRVAVREAELLPHSPGTRRHVGKDMTVRDLCRTTMVTSDNLAANLLLGCVDGPAGVTAFLRETGDTVTRNDRAEPEMNRFAHGDPRDTTSPAAMAATLQRLLFGEVLSPASRQQLADWMIDNQTGDDCLRAGLDARWRVGDKTGSNGTDTRNDVAVMWPLAGGRPWILSAYLQGARVNAQARDAVLARVAALAQAFIDARDRGLHGG